MKLFFIIATILFSTHSRATSKCNDYLIQIDQQKKPDLALIAIKAIISLELKYLDISTVKGFERISSLKHRSAKFGGPQYLAEHYVLTFNNLSNANSQLYIFTLTTL